MDRSGGGRPEKNSFQAGTSLQDTGIARTSAYRWQLMSSLPKEQVKEYLGDTSLESREVTSAGILRLAQTYIAEQKRDEVDITTSSDFPDQKYRTIVVDPPC